jgi:hypothetical protein
MNHDHHHRAQTPESGPAHPHQLAHWSHPLVSCGAAVGCGFLFGVCALWYRLSIVVVGCVCVVVSTDTSQPLLWCVVVVPPTLLWLWVWVCHLWLRFLGPVRCQLCSFSVSGVLLPVLPAVSSVVSHLSVLASILSFATLTHHHRTRTLDDGTPAGHTTYSHPHTRCAGGG